MTIPHSAFTGRLGIRHPIIQAPMAGTATPALAAAVSNAGGLGSLGVGATNAAGAGAMIAAFRDLSNGPLNINVFCHQPATAYTAREAAWIERLRPAFAEFSADPPVRLVEPYTSFVVDDEMLALLLEVRPAVVSFHFGLPARAKVQALRGAGIMIFSSATRLDEARLAIAAGADAIVAQGYEAGGHRGIFDVKSDDAKLGALALTRILVRALDIPIIAAGGIMDGGGIAAALHEGAVAAQLGTAFIAAPESAADQGYRAALLSDAAEKTVMTYGISGRPARCLANRFTEWATGIASQDVPDYPIAYDAGKALNAAAKAKGEAGYGAHWAGVGAPRARALPAAQLMAILVRELEAA